MAVPVRPRLAVQVRRLVEPSYLYQVVGIGAGFGVEDAGGVEFLDLDASGTMDDALGVDDDTDMGDVGLAVGYWLLAIGGWLVVIKEGKVTGLREGEVGDGFALRGLLGSVTQQLFAEEGEDDLGETGAVHSHGVLPAP